LFLLLPALSIVAAFMAGWPEPTKVLKRSFLVFSIWSITILTSQSLKNATMASTAAAVSRTREAFAPSNLFWEVQRKGHLGHFHHLLGDKTKMAFSKFIAEERSLAVTSMVVFHSATFYRCC